MGYADVLEVNRAVKIRRGTRTVTLGLWLLAGLFCVLLDDQLQPCLTALGENGLVRACAEKWQDLGSTLGIVAFLAAGFITWKTDRGRTLLRFVVCVLLVGIIVQAIKYSVGRARPNSVHDVTHFFGPFGWFNTGPIVPIDSMPSGHTAAAFAMATTLAMRWPMAKWVVFPLAIGVGISRTLVDRHFPSDVVVGSLLGSVLAMAAWTWSQDIPTVLSERN